MAGVVVTGMLAVGLAGCSGQPEVRVTPGTATVTVAVGETLVVDFGEINSSVGDEWRIAAEPDAGVLAAGVAEYEDLEPDAVGAPVTLEYRFEALAPGTTTIGFEYLYRGEAGDPEGRAGGDATPEIAVTVTE